MASFHRFAKLAGSAAIAAMIISSHSFAESSGETGAGGASSSAGSSGGPSSTSPGTTDSKAGTSARRTETAPEVSGAPPQANTEAPIGAAAGRKRVRAGTVTPETNGGSAREGARGSSMENCMAAWDEKTHLSQDRWRETCARTLDENL